MSKRFNQDELFKKGIHGCPKCQKIKSLDDFDKHKNNRHGVQDYCKICKSEIHKRYMSINENKEKRRKSTFNWKKNNSEKVLENKKKWKKNNPEKVRNSELEWRINNPEKVRKYKTITRQKMRDNLKDCYVKQTIIQQFDIPTSEITIEMLMLKRVELKSKRIIKKSKKVEL